MPDNRIIESFVLIKGELGSDAGKAEYTLFLENKNRRRFRITLRGWSTDLSEKVNEFIKMYISVDAQSLHPPIAIVVCEYTPDITARNRLGKNFKLLKFLSQGDLLALSLSPFTPKKQQDQG